MVAETIREQLDAVEEAAFVGRTEQLAEFDRLVTDRHSPRRVLFVHGPGGVGKTTLLRALRRRCRVRGIDEVFVDGRRIDATSSGLLAALGHQLGLDPRQVIPHLATRSERLVLFVDTWELLAALDPWLRRDLLPALSREVVVVLGSRRPPGVAWRADPGWRSLVAAVQLRNLPPADSLTMLRRLGVPAASAREVLHFTHGHPLALALVGDVCAQQPDGVMVADAALDAIPILLDRLVSDVSSPDQRAALEAAAIVRVTGEPLLAAMLELEDAGDLFAWLRGLGCMEVDPDGLRPHDVVRAALAADLRWRNPQRHAALHERARHHLQARFHEVAEERQPAVLHDLLFLHRDNPLVAPFFDWDAGPGIVADDLRANEQSLVLAATRQYAGEQAATIHAHWLGHAAAQTVALRSDDEVLGFLTMVSLGDVTAADRRVDPVLDAVVGHLDGDAPLRPGEVGILFRSWLALVTGQQVSPIQGAVFLEVARRYLTTARLARTYFCCLDAEFWTPVLDNFDIPRVPDSEFPTSPGLGVFSHDWRVRPPLAWLDLLAARETNRGRTSPPAAAGEVLVLSEPDFAAAVRDALRVLHRPERLARNPLLRSRLVVERVPADASSDERVHALRGLVQATTGAAADPRVARGQRAVHHTWIEPVGTQEQAADVLDLPFSTYRRHLREGLDMIVRALWHLELGGDAADVG